MSTLYNPCGGDLALDFVDSIGRTPASLQNERLVDYPALVTWCIEAGVLPESRGRVSRRLARERPDEAEAVLGRARELREAIFATFLADVRGARPPREALERINHELAGALAHARVEHRSGEWIWAWAAEDSLEAPLWPVVRAAADLLVSPDRERVKECASETCVWLFVDRTKNHGRRWCEMAGCGNLHKVRRHRRRKKAEALKRSAR